MSALNEHLVTLFQNALKSLFNAATATVGAGAELLTPSTTSRTPCHHHRAHSPASDLCHFWPFSHLLCPDDQLSFPTSELRIVVPNAPV